MAVPSTLTASIGIAAVAAFVLLATPAAVAQEVCKSIDARGNVTYRDCPPPSTYNPERPARPVPTVEEERSPAPAPATAERPRETARWLPGSIAPQGAATNAAPRTTYSIAGGALLIGGMLVSFGASIAYLVAAFRVSLWWGLGCLFVTPVSFLFLVLHWKVARKPFFVSVAGIAAAVVGYVLVGGS